MKEKIGKQKNENKNTRDLITAATAKLHVTDSKNNEAIMMLFLNNTNKI